MRIEFNIAPQVISKQKCVLNMRGLIPKFLRAKMKRFGYRYNNNVPG